jgi:hypothetical protein
VTVTVPTQYMANSVPAAGVRVTHLRTAPLLLLSAIAILLGFDPWLVAGETIVKGCRRFHRRDRFPMLQRRCYPDRAWRRS